MNEINPILIKIEKEISVAFTELSISSSLSLSSSYVRDAINTHLMQPTLNIMQSGGKRLRPLLVVLLTNMFAGNEKEAYLFAPLIEGIHCASLIHDDIEDSSCKRRSNPNIHIKYGVDVALNAGSALYFFSIALIERNADVFRGDLYKLCINALQKLHIGQAMDIKHHSDYPLVFDLSMYESLVSLKTGALFSLASEAALVFSNKHYSEHIEIFLFNELGIVFQMLDDLRNVSMGNKGKDKGDDIVEGKLSFPIILFLDKKPEERNRIILLFREAKREGIESAAVQECLSLLKSSGVIEEGIEIANKRMNSIFEKLYNIHNGSLQLDIISSIFHSI